MIAARSIGDRFERELRLSQPRHVCPSTVAASRQAENYAGKPVETGAR